MYAASTLREWGTTKSLSPLPYSDLNLLELFEAHRTGEKKSRQRITAYQHLTDEEKAAYVLCTLLEPVTLKMVEGKEPEEIQVIFTHMKETLIRSYGEVSDNDGGVYRLLEDPHAVVDYVFGGPRGFCENYRDSLPVELGAVVDVEVLPDRPVRAPVRLAPTQPIDTLGTDPLPTDDDFLMEIIGSTLPGKEIDPWGAPSDSTVEAKVSDLPSLLSTVLKSTLLLGAPRSGKGYAMAKAIDLLPETVDLWGIDPKNDPSENRYWKRFSKDQLIRFDCTELNPIAVANNCLNLFERFSSTPCSADKPKLLIVDEAAPGLSSCELNKGQLEEDEYELANWFKELMLKCARLASVGPSKGKFVWVLSQSSTGKDLGISNGNKGGYRIVAVGHKDTAPTWFDSINASLKIGKPSTDVLQTGYIQNDGTGWYRGKKFNLED